MSHKFKNIEKIYFDDIEGKIGNAFIYNLSFTQGYSADPSKLTIHAISEDGDYSTVPTPNFSEVYTVKIGNMVVFKGFIITKEKKISGNEKTVSITLVDKSIRLESDFKK